MNASRSTASLSVYITVGPVLTHYLMDRETGVLTSRQSITLPSRAQYGCAHSSLPVLYVCGADRGAAGEAQPYHLCAFLRDEQGDLTPHGVVVPLPARPIHLTVDRDGRHVFVAYTGAPGISVHIIAPDGTIGEEVPRATDFHVGVKPHQVCVTPDDERAILVIRGAKGFGKPSYVGGGFQSLRFDQGEVANVALVEPAPDRAPRGFNPRAIDFHPTMPLVFATLEAQNEVSVHACQGHEIDPAPLFTHSLLEHPEAVHKGQDGGEVHVHPDGRHVYVANRNDGYAGVETGPSWLTPDPVPVFAGGENSIAVFRIEDAGRLTLVQHVSTRGLHPRTVALDPAGRFLIAANIAPTLLGEGEDLTPVPASLCIFRIGADGQLTFLHKHDLDVAPEKLWWVGIVA